eukprot:9302441-Ditylum_brightwellii.AAC.1
MTWSKSCQTQCAPIEPQQSAGIRQEQMEYNSTISRDLNGAKGPRLTCINDMEQITPNLMCTNQNSTISRDWTGADGAQLNNQHREGRSRWSTTQQSAGI